MSGGPARALDDERLDALERAVQALDARLAAIEASAIADGGARAFQTEGARALQPDVETSEIPETTPSFDTVSLLTLVGRTLMTLGGAYLLRALTESAIWPPAVGITIGFAYAAVWLVVADRVAGVRRPALGERAGPGAQKGRVEGLSAVFFGGSAVLIALPLLWESVMRFRVVDPTAASVILTGTTLAVLAAAVRARLHALAWIAVCGALPASLALTAATGAVVPFAAANVALGVATLWIGYTVDWVWLRWPVAMLANLSVFALALGVSSHTATSPPSHIVATQLLLLSGYLVSIAIRTLVRGREVIVFEALQSVCAMAIGFGGAAYLAQATGTGRALLVSIALACGAGSYAVAFAFVVRRQGVQRNFFFYTSVALILSLSGAALGLPESAVWFAALAVACAWLAARSVTGRLTLTIHASAYLLAAALASGLMVSAIRALTGLAVLQSLVSPRQLLVFAAGCVCWLLRPAREADGAEEAARYAGVPRVAIGLVVTVAAAAWLAALGLSGTTTPGVAATVRTSALAITALCLAWIGRRTRLTEAAWLVYPTLATGALKLIVEDLPQSSASTLFVALAMYGGALIAAPRLLRGR